MKPKKYTVASAVCFCFRYALGATVLKWIIEVANGVLMPLMVLVVASFLDHALAFVRGGTFLPLAGSLALMAAYYAYAQIGPVLVRLADKAQENALRENLRPRLVDKQAHTVFSLLEDSATLDLIARVCGSAEERIMGIGNSGLRILRLGVQTFGTLTLLAVHVWWMLPLFLLSAIPIAAVAYRGGQAIYRMDQVTTKLTRMQYDLSAILAGRETAAERTLFGYADHVNRKFAAAHLKRSNMVTKEIAIEEITINLCGLLLNALVVVAVFALLRPVGAHALSHGLYVALVGALVGLARMITGTVSRLVRDAAGQIAYMRDFTSFFALPETQDREKKGTACGDASFARLEIRDLRFRYTPGSDYVLNGVNLVMEAGKSYSLIGRNGAGKSTLTKILLGLYRDFEGEIRINGIPIAQYGDAQLRRLFSIVYQDFAKYAVSLRDNITLGGPDEGLQDSIRLAELEAVVAKLPNKADTPLGKIYEGGVDISGGEWQKLAIARALNANTPFMILDEPTASLSPMMEGKLYRRFADLTKGKTSLLISHRLGSTKLSDELFVLEEGVIAETGTHDALMAAKGLYADMFQSQRSWYDER